jgi:hypothetical protein
MVISNLRKSIFYLQQAIRNDYPDNKVLAYALDLLILVEKNNAINALDGHCKIHKHMENDKVYLITSVISVLTETINPLVGAGEKEAVDVVVGKIVELVDKIVIEP